MVAVHNNRLVKKVAQKPIIIALISIIFLIIAFGLGALIPAAAQLLVRQHDGYAANITELKKMKGVSALADTIPVSATTIEYHVAPNAIYVDAAFYISGPDVEEWIDNQVMECKPITSQSTIARTIRLNGKKVDFRITNGIYAIKQIIDPDRNKKNNVVLQQEIIFDRDQGIVYYFLISERYDLIEKVRIDTVPSEDAIPRKGEG